MKKQEGYIKYTTIPNSKWILGVLWSVDIFFAIMGLIMLPREESFMVLSVVAALCVIIVILNINKYGNVLMFTNEKITLKKQSISWNEVYLTTYCRKPNMRNSYDIYIYFDDHYLTEAEVFSRTVKRKGFYIILNYERTDYILSKYPKRVEVLNGAVIDRDGVMSMISMHNTTVS